MSKLLDPIAILALADIKPAKVEIPEWGCHVFVRAVTAAEATTFEPGAGKDESTRLALIVARCACNEVGVRLWTDADIPKLNKLPLGPIAKIVEAVNSLNGLTDQAVSDLGEASKETPGEGSPSSSQATSAE